MDDTAVDEVREGVSSPAYPATRRGELEPALAGLSTRQRQAVSLRYLAGLDEFDVSEALGISVRAVRKAAAEGLAALRSRGVVLD